jgi:hypothetical protein
MAAGESRRRRVPDWGGAGQPGIHPPSPTVSVRQDSYRGGVRPTPTALAARMVPAAHRWRRAPASGRPAAGPASPVVAQDGPDEHDDACELPTACPKSSGRPHRRPPTRGEPGTP